MITILGCGGHAKSVADIILKNDKSTKLLFVDENALPDERIWGFKVIKPSENSYPINFIAVGDNKKRETYFNSFDKKHLINVISHNAYLGKCTNFGIGTMVGDFSKIGPEVEIGMNSIVNTAAIVEHETKIGNNCHIAPSACICGRVKIGNNVFVGAGATIIDKIEICSDVIIGAGTVVVKNITESGVYLGVPARRVK